MKYRILDDGTGLFYAERRWFFFFWCYVTGSWSHIRERTEAACRPPPKHKVVKYL